MAYGKMKALPFDIIVKAKAGDENALNAVIHHYSQYIRSLATRVKPFNSSQFTIIA